jgi:ribose-phosphate pyrophosphokinase
MIKVNGETVQFQTFPNGETLMVEQSIKDAFGTSLFPVVSFKYESDADLIRLMFVKKYLDSLGEQADLVIYYMPYSRMDRSENGSAFTLKYVSEFINGLDFDEVTVIEAHSDVTPALLDRSTSILVNEQLITVVMNEVDFDLAEDYLVYPDAGAQKRYSKFFDGNTLVGHKERDFQTGRIKKLDIIGDYNGKGKKAVIVDDLTSYGGTFIMTAEKLKAMGFEEIYLLVAHCENSIFKGKILNTDLIKKVFTTNTIVSHTQDGWDDDYADKLDITDIEELLS